MMVKIGFEDVGKYDKATFVCLQHSDCRDKTPEDLPEDKQEVWEKFKQELASLKEDWIVTEAVLFPSVDDPTETVEIKVSARHVSIELPAPRVAVKIFTSREIPALKKKDKDLMEFLKWIAGTKSE
jgi:hypothetical protein